MSPALFRPPVLPPELPSPPSPRPHLQGRDTRQTSVHPRGGQSDATQSSTPQCSHSQHLGRGAHTVMARLPPPSPPPKVYPQSTDIRSSCSVVCRARDGRTREGSGAERRSVRKAQ